MIRSGRLEVIAGGMYSGKTEELIRRLQRARYARMNIQVFKPLIDDRYHKEDVTSHSQTSISAFPVAGSAEIVEHLLPSTQVIGIDEGQFFDGEIVRLCQLFADKGLRVIVAGLDTDWQGLPFGPMPELMAVADEVLKQNAICMVCGGPASRTQRVAESDSQILIGSLGLYEARCRQHFKPEVLPPAQHPMIGLSREADSSIEIVK